MVVGDTGLEPVSVGGHAADSAGTNPGHSSEKPCAVKGCDGQVEDTAGTQRCTLASGPCCTCVADEGLVLLITQWEILPEYIRHTILSLVNGVIKP